MRGQRGVARHFAVFVLVLSLLAGSFGAAAATEEDLDEPASAETGSEAGDDTSENEEGSDTEEDVTGEEKPGEVEALADVASDEDATAEVRFSVTSADSSILDTLPAGTMWTIAGEADNGKTVDFGGEAQQDAALPHEFLASSEVPFGTFVMTFDPNGDIEYVSRAIEVNEASVTVGIELTPITDSQVTLNLSPSNPELVDTLPGTASWTISHTEGGGVVADGTFTEEQRQLPTSIALESGVPYGEYLVTIAANWAFQPYERVHVIDAPIQELDIELQVQGLLPIPTMVTVSLPDGAEGEAAFRYAIDHADSQENIDSGSGTFSLPTTLWEGELLPGEYWVSIYPEGDYLAISDQISVIPNVPTASFDFELVPLGPEPTVEPTQTPTEPAVTPTVKPDMSVDDKTETKVTTLPSTGQGSGSASGGVVGALVLGMVSLVLMGMGAIWRLRRVEA